MSLYPDSLTFVEFADSLVVANPPEPVEDVPAYMSGLPSDEIFSSVGDSTVVVGILIFIAVLLMLWTRGVRRTLKTYKSELWSQRRRRNVFDSESGLSVPVALVLALGFIIFAATDIYIGLNLSKPLVLRDYFTILGLIAGFYVFKLVCYALVGYAFAIPPGGRLWLMGYNAAKAYTGLILIIPTFAALYIPQVAQWILPFTILMWLIGQIVFICKGFRIFYRDFGSVFYFFLYLCTLEIIPSFALAAAVFSVLGMTVA